MQYQKMAEDGLSVRSVSTVSTTASEMRDNDKFEEAIQEISGDRYNIPDTPLGHVRLRAKKIVEHVVFRIVTIILIIVDLAIGIADISLAMAADGTASPSVLEALDYASLVFSIYFVLEIALRIFARGPKDFFTKVWEVIDFSVIVVLFILVATEVGLNDNPLKYAKLLTIFRFIRIIRISMVLRAVAHQKHVSRGIRLTVSQNKRRYQKDGFDIDLCYVTDRLLAMSFPSSGTTSLYRNPIEEVSRFFNTKYKGHYKIYNLCSEKHYDADKFFDGMVDRICIDDHNVPSLSQMLEFCVNANQWMTADVTNIMAIHCKGGKGRTGTLVCVWLLHSGIFDKAEDALEFFATRRTDLSVSSKFQGVETPSQSRYVGYFEKIKKFHGGSLPPTKKVTAQTLTVTGLRGVGKGDGSDLSIKFMPGGHDVAFEAVFGQNSNCQYSFDPATSKATVRLMGAPELSGDIKVMFFSTSDIPRGYDDCPFYFWFNTSFIDDCGRLVLSRNELDNPHKEKVWKFFKADFSVLLDFQLS